ncbi:hypothetical protein CLIB1423_20S00606 [[Candida] railenensis]|uniref:Uncharacterized protein n=1 Tax=[Candida] railenensis TaxID=45579 RepID=A0A9P0VZG4_9ASCO|nr:hypothetical protein CLIB1423_20S00606 [[Candida] railenensis]
MSHYMLISAKAVEKKRLPNGKNNGAASSQRSIQSSSRNSISSGRRNADAKSFISTSTSSTSSSKSGKRKMVFDINKNCYVNAETLITPPDLAVIRYERKLNKILDCHYKVLNQKMNSQYLHDSMDSNSNFLISRKNLNMLRYIYFEDFVVDQKITEKKTKENIPKPRLSYMKRIQRINNKSHKVVKGLPSMGLDAAFINESEEEEEEEEDASEEEERERNLEIRSLSISPDNASRASATTVDDLYGDYLGGNNAKIGCEKRGMRTVFESGQFWNSVYQDFKIEEPEYFEYLPAINQLQSFYIEVVDYLLYHIRILEISTEAPELAKFKSELAEHYFFYMRDDNYEWFNIMSSVHSRLFRFGRDYSARQLAQVELILIKKLLSTISSNIVSTLRPNGGSAQSKEKCLKTFKLWDEFMDFTFVELIHKRENYETKLSPINTNIPSQVQSSTETINANNSNAIPRNASWSLSDSRNPSIVSSTFSGADSILSVKTGKTTTDLSVPILEAEELFYSNKKGKDAMQPLPKQKKSGGIKGLFRKK